MKNFLLRSPYEDLKIFQDIEAIDIPSALNCLKGIEKIYRKDEWIIRLGQSIEELGILLEGQVYLYNINSLGERNIISQLDRGNLIGSSMVFSEENISPYDAICVRPCRILMINPDQIKTDVEPACSFKSRIMKNLLFMISEENRSLRVKLDITAVKSLREKIFNYLYLQANIQKKSTFTIPFVNRADFADYLGVNCSALSRELGRMRDEQILDFYKNSFILKQIPKTEKRK